MNKRRTVFLSSGLPSMFVIFSILCMVILNMDIVKMIVVMDSFYMLKN